MIEAGQVVEGLEICYSLPDWMISDEAENQSAQEDIHTILDHAVVITERETVRIIFNKGE